MSIQLFIRLFFNSQFSQLLSNIPKGSFVPFSSNGCFRFKAFISCLSLSCVLLLFGKHQSYIWVFPLQLKFPDISLVIYLLFCTGLPNCTDLLPSIVVGNLQMNIYNKASFTFHLFCSYNTKNEYLHREWKYVCGCVRVFKTILSR